MAKYYKDYLIAKEKEEFVKLLWNRYKVKRETAVRRWYDVRQIGNANIKIEQKSIKPVEVYVDTDSKMPDIIKMQTLNDMKRYGYKLTKLFLRKHGFSEYEINWVESKEGKLERE